MNPDYGDTAQFLWSKVNFLQNAHNREKRAPFLIQSGMYAPILAARYM